MNAKTILCISLTGAILSIITGCGPTAKMALNLTPQSEAVYKVIVENGKDYEFVQPSINKTKEQHTVGRTEITFVQKIENVDSNGNAIANITIKELKYLSKGPKGKTFDFDSTDPKNKDQPLAALIGQSYTIKITPNGQVEVLDAASARGAVKRGFAKKIAARLLSEDEIKKRHQVLALVDARKGKLKKGDSWSSIAGSPRGMLRPKSYEKIYTIEDIKEQNGQQIAVVSLKAVPSSKRAPDLPRDDKGMGFFANIFDEQDEFKGRMVINLTTGQIQTYQEHLKAQWVAVEPPEEQKSDKGPDQLTMGFSHLYRIEKVE